MFVFDDVMISYLVILHQYIAAVGHLPRHLHHCCCGGTGGAAAGTQE